MSAAHMTIKQLTRLVDVVGGPAAALDLVNHTGTTLPDLLASLPPERFVRIRLGDFETPTDFVAALTSVHIKLDEQTADLIVGGGVQLHPRATETDLVFLYPDELSGSSTSKYPRERIYRHARWMGLRLCPAEAGPQLRLTLRDRTERQSVIVASDPILDKRNCSRLFWIGHDGKDPWLSGLNCSDHDEFYARTHLWAFRLPAA